MKTLQTYTPNELKDVAKRNYHTIIQLLNEAGIQPIMRHQKGTRAYTYYGSDALEFVTNIRAADDAKKADKQARKDAWAAKRAAAAERRAMKGQKKKTPADVIQEQLPLQLPPPLGTGPSLRELVTETNRLLQEMIDFWKK